MTFNEGNRITVVRTNPNDSGDEFVKPHIGKSGFVNRVYDEDRGYDYEVYLDNGEKVAVYNSEIEAEQTEGALKVTDVPTSIVFQVGDTVKVATELFGNKGIVTEVTGRTNGFYDVQVNGNTWHYYSYELEPVTVAEKSAEIDQDALFDIYHDVLDFGGDALLGKQLAGLAGDVSARALFESLIVFADEILLQFERAIPGIENRLEGADH